ncbi:MAG: hypothetical protein WC030_00670 [Candidatus Paceibacterota bacterium]
MQPISERARQIIEDFTRSVSALPIEERAEAVRRATETLTALQDDAKTLYDTLQEEMGRARPAEGASLLEEDGDVENISDYM